MKDQFRIVRLIASNVKRIRSVDITPKGDVVSISGRNSQGKSSVLDCIAYAIGGKSLCPDRPIRDGQKTAEIVLDLGPLKVRRVFTASGSRVEITNSDGTKLASPQAVLDSFAGRLTFDPLEFARMKATQQREALLELSGVQDTLNVLDETKRATLDRRAKLSADLSYLETRIGTIPALPPDHPTQLLDLSDVKRQQEAHAQATRERDGAAAHLQRRRDALQSKQNERDAAIAKLEAMRAAIERQKTLVEQLKAECVRDSDEVVRAANEVDAIVIPEAPTPESVVKIVEINKRIEANKERQQLLARVANIQTEIDFVTRSLAMIAAHKQEALGSASFPVAGLGYDETGVTINGVPFEQASASEQLRISVAMAMAMNPTLRVILIRDGSLLDDDSLAIIANEAQQRGYQVWLEVVDTSGAVGIVIEDGSVAAVN